MSKKVRKSDEWLTKQEAARYLGLAEKTLDRMAQKGKVQKATCKRLGLPPVAVFHLADLAAIKAEREQLSPAPFVAAGVEQARPQVQGALISALTAIADRVAPELKEPFFLTLKQARETTGLPIGFLRGQFIQGGHAVKTGRGWRIRRTDLEQFGRNGHTPEAPAIGQVSDAP